MILIVGATGLLGGTIVHELLRQGRSVRVLVRPESSYKPLVDAGGQPVLADLKDRSSLDRACDGVSAVITTASAGSRGGEDTIQSVDLEGNHNLIDAAAAAGVRHFVLTSVFGASTESPLEMHRAKTRSEQRLRESGMTYTILALNGILDVWVPQVVTGPLKAGAPVTLVGEGRRRHSFITIRDTAAFAAASLDRAAARNRHVPLGGPEAVSWRDIVEAAERVMGRDIPLRFVPLGAPVPGLPPFVSNLMTALETYDSPIDMRETAAAFGVTQTTLAEYLAVALALDDHILTIKM